MQASAFAKRSASSLGRRKSRPRASRRTTAGAAGSRYAETRDSRGHARARQWAAIALAAATLGGAASPSRHARSTSSASSAYEASIPRRRAAYRFVEGAHLAPPRGNKGGGRHSADAGHARVEVRAAAEAKRDEVAPTPPEPEARAVVETRGPGLDAAHRRAADDAPRAVYIYRKGLRRNKESGRRRGTEERVAVLGEHRVRDAGRVQRRARRLRLAGRRHARHAQGAQHANARGAARSQGLDARARSLGVASGDALPRVAGALDDDDEPRAEAEEERRATVH